jgi:hypothetical protein
VLIVEDSDGFPIWVDTEGAAELLTQTGIVNARDRIYDWKRRGLLTPHHMDGRSPIYRMADVDRVELETRRNGRGPGRVVDNRRLITDHCQRQTYAS